MTKLTYPDTQDGLLITNWPWDNEEILKKTSLTEAGCTRLVAKLISKQFMIVELAVSAEGAQIAFKIILTTSGGVT